MQAQLAKDLKQALLNGDKAKTETLKGLKNALQYEAVALGAQTKGLSDEQIQKVLAREAKKRQEAADLYRQNGAEDRAKAELAEKAIIDAYLPEPVSRDKIEAAVKAEIAKLQDPTLQNMGKIIGAVRQQLGPGADGALIAQIIKAKLS